MKDASHKRFASSALVAALGCGLVGCSMYPLPDDVSRATTFDIVQRVRCEAKAGVDRFLESDGHAQAIIAATAIGYDFEFEISEENKEAEGLLKFIRPPTAKGNTTFKLDVEGGARRARSNTRAFQIIEDLVDLKTARCSRTDIEGTRLYPITGALGMDEVVGTYIGLEKLSDTQAPKNAPTKIAAHKGKVPVFADSLEFRTKLSLGATPTLVLTAVSGDLKLTNASVNAQVSRTDKHSLIVALARDPDKDVDPKIAIAKMKRRLMLAAEVVQESRTETALAQRDTLASTHVLLELKRLRNLKDDARDAPRFLGEKLLEFLRPPAQILDE